MAGGSVSSSFLLVNLHGARSPMRPKNVILLEINIIATNFNEVDLLYYLLFDAFARRLRVWCTMVAVERCWPPSFSLLAPSCLIFLRSVCVFASTWPETLTDSCLGTVLVQIPTLTVNISVNFSPILII